MFPWLRLVPGDLAFPLLCDCCLLPAATICLLLPTRNFRLEPSLHWSATVRKFQRKSLWEAHPRDSKFLKASSFCSPLQSQLEILCLQNVEEPTRLASDVVWFSLLCGWLGFFSLGTFRVFSVCLVFWNFITQDLDKGPFSCMLLGTR